MALGDRRRNLRIHALETAAQYIRIMESGGATPEELVEDVEDIDEDILYDLMRDHGDVEECEITIYGPLEHEIEEEWDEE